VLDSSGAVLLNIPFQLAVAGGASDTDSPTMLDKTSVEVKVDCLYSVRCIYLHSLQDLVTLKNWDNVSLKTHG